MTEDTDGVGVGGMTKYKQLVSGDKIGDCFRACLATLLQLPPQVLPNDFSPMWTKNWRNYLSQFGLALSNDNGADKPIWLSTPWIASVKSLNYKDTTHAILMHQGGVVLHDPSNKKCYKAGMNLLGKNIVMSGQHLVVIDSTKLHLLHEYREMISPPKTPQSETPRGEVL